MTYTFDFSLSLGSSQTSLTDLRAQLFNSSGVNVGSEVSSGFSEIGGGNYIWHYAAIPDGHRGGVKFYRSSGSVMAIASINPQEIENPDIKTSAVWDESLTGSSHNIANSAGKRLRQLSAQYIHSGTAAGGGNNYIDLDSGASSTDDIYDPSLVFIESGTGAGQSREVYQYDGATKRAWVSRNWRTNPNTSSVFQVYSFSGNGHTNEGICGGGTANTITLNRNALSINDYYVGQVVVLVSGTGEDQADRIIAYNGTTKVATVDHGWSVVPVANDTVYAMYPTAQIDQDYIASAVWDEPISGHLTPETTGYRLNTSGSTNDPLLNTVPGIYTQGTAGFSLGRIGSGFVSTTYPITSTNVIVLVKGSDYLAADGQAIDWTDTMQSWPDLTSGSVVFAGTKTTRDYSFNVAGSVITATGISKKVRAEPTSVDTGALGIGDYKYNVYVDLPNGHKVTLIADSPLRVVQKYPIT